MRRRAVLLRTEVDEVIRDLEDVQVVLDDEHGVALIHQTLEHINQHLNVLKMQSRGGFIQHIEGLAGATRASSVASLTRWASPPDKVVDCCPKVMYPKPTSWRVLAMRLSLERNQKLHRLVDGHAQTSDMDLPR